MSSTNWQTIKMCYCHHVGKDVGLEAQVVFPSDVLPDQPPRVMENHRFRPEILQVLEGERGTSLRFSSTVKEEMLYVAVPIRDQSAIKGVLRVSLYLAVFNRHFSRVRNSIVYSAIGLSLLALLAACVISRSLSRPISDLRIAAGRLASGDFTSRVIIRDSGEIQDLAQSFNFMIGEINTLFTRLTDQRDQLNSIISSIQEGLLVFDRTGRITLCNESFKNVFTELQHGGKVLLGTGKDTPLQ